MVIELQPPQVLQKNKKFACKLRHLVADGLAIHQYPFEMSVNLIDEETAAQVMEQNSAPFRFSGHIQNNKVLSSFNDTSKQLVVRMSNLSLTKTDEDRGRNAVVANEKLCMFFSAPIQIKFPSMREAVVVVKTISLPIVIITHGKQESDAEGTIFWDNAFSEMRRKPFFITTAVPLFILLDRLDLIWKKRSKEEVMAKQRINEEPRGLDKIARKFLTEKLFRHCDVNPFTTVNWNQFQKENVCQSQEKITFSFWKYFYNIMKLTCSEHMNEIWNAGHIYGFVGREESEKLLKNAKCATGTFLFRFSQSVLGAVSISCRTHGDRFGQVVVGHFKPDTIKTFRERMSLVDTVRKMKQLVYFYPNIPKQNVVGEAAQSGQVSWYVDKPVDM
ncbi:signal transducer and activator of transcription 5B-like isoform X2 [Clavelina lepadiformis]|uniref:SH2 domain-containing protein n=1 Tax=Clavelina lepadiformis TaxID=159417 RepID=A0ABP0H2J1_CLALP